LAYSLTAAGPGGTQVLTEVIAARPPAKVDQTNRRVSVTLPADAEAALKHPHDASTTRSHDDLNDYNAPTEEEEATLRKVPDAVRFVSFALCLVEFAERASYYGAKTVFNNFIQFPLPAGEERTPSADEDSANQAH
jgi:hypothetical protein